VSYVPMLRALVPWIPGLVRLLLPPVGTQTGKDTSQIN
jgi:hypothetical protein